MSGGIYVISLLDDDMMSRPSKTNSSGGMCRNRRGKHTVYLATGAALLLSSSFSSSSLLPSFGLVYAGVGGGVQWLLRRTARPVLSDSLNASRVLRRRIYNKIVKLSSLLMLFIWC